ncbi:hypothetical protein P152DRAFT_238936 [Eremomyces bilateralis CBS 781.70]|uniref:Uncharacterized protein n=1 Tax=Eremomyces bilateralis CBS 781.70 TaxID=1392243 RepID=A0A6G1GAJ9_9PEZI|nr:uncharacterized protein P152DRAFT_238936 [Eremomyces bilateralis CBS 781.70]KAF1814930.1 hypothetical protein P152DRAFT_238936 [Eremomyces bilateralis CBS 781.70]
MKLKCLNIKDSLKRERFIHPSGLSARPMWERCEMVNWKSGITSSCHVQELHKRSKSPNSNHTSSNVQCSRSGGTELWHFHFTFMSVTCVHSMYGVGSIERAGNTHGGLRNRVLSANTAITKYTKPHARPAWLHSHEGNWQREMQSDGLRCSNRLQNWSLPPQVGHLPCWMVKHCGHPQLGHRQTTIWSQACSGSKGPISRRSNQGLNYL